MKKGFTLIEMLVVVGVVTLILPVIFSILFAILRQQAKVYALKQVKREGDFVLNSIENVIRTYATGVYSDQALTTPICSGVGPFPESITTNQIYFDSKISSGAWFGYSLPSGGAVASSSSVTTPSTQNLTSSNVTISNLSFTCTRNSSFSPPLIGVSFDVGYNLASVKAEERATLHYQTQIKLRNY